MPAYPHAPALIVIIGCAFAACAAPSSTPPQNSGAQAPAAAGEADQRLAAEVGRFLDAWVAKQQPQAAVEGKASTAFVDSRFIPAATQSSDEYRAAAAAAAAPSATTITPERFQSAIEAQLTAALGDDASPGAAPAQPPALDSLLVPFSPEAAREKQPDLWAIIGDRNPRSLVIAGVPSLAYQVREWRDISWTASATVGFRFAMADIINKRGINAQAVITRLKPIGSPGEESLIVTLWSDEGGAGAQWRVFGVEQPATQ